MTYETTASALIIRSLPEIADGTDLGKRIFKGQIVEVVGTSLDGKWSYVDAPAARGWVSMAYLKKATAFLPSPAWPRVPNGLAEIVRIYGEPGKPICSAGRVHLPAPLKLGWKDENVTIIACHKLVEDVFTSVFAAIATKDLWEHLRTFDGIYNDRPVKAGGGKKSTHAWGIGVDINAATNKKNPGDINPRIVAIFKDHGFVWGQEFNDPMHFQYAKGY